MNKILRNSMTSAALVAGFALAAASLSACQSAPDAREVTITLNRAPTKLAGATIRADYTKSGASPLIRDGRPDCATIAHGVNATYSDDGRNIVIQAEASQPMSAPVDLAVCKMLPDDPSTSGDAIAGRLEVGLAKARDAKGQEVDSGTLLAMRAASGAKSAGGGNAIPGSGKIASRAGSAGQAAADAAGAAGRAVADGAKKAGSAAAGAANVLKNGVKSAADQGAAAMKITKQELDAARQKESGVARDYGAGDRASMGVAGDAGESGDAADGGSPDEGAAAEEEEANDPEDSMPSGSVSSYDVIVGVTSRSGPLGALQFNLNHTGSSGGWQGAGGGVNCRYYVGALKQCNDKGAGNIACAVIDTTGFSTPSEVVSCVFKTNDALSASDFSVQLVDASSPDVEAAPPDVDIAITSVARR